MRTPGAANWTTEREDELRAHWANGESAAVIAEVMGDGLTRNSVLGKAHRMGLPGRKTVARKAPRTPRRRLDARTMSVAVRLGKARKTDVQTVEEALSHIKAKPLPGEAWDALPDTTPIPLMMLSDETCRWPIGDPLTAGFGFCGCPVEAGRVYCAPHRALGTTEFKATAEDKRKLEKLDMSRRVFA